MFAVSWNVALTVFFVGQGAVVQGNFGFMRY